MSARGTSRRNVRNMSDDIEARDSTDRKREGSQADE
jgi:hypothetical protein